MSKVFVLGLDGATFDLIEPWVDEGRLPNIREVMKEGAYGDLASAIPAHSAPSWSSFITGKNPGKHGIFDFAEHVANSYRVRFVNAICRKAESIWAILSKFDKRVGIINVPMTYPPEAVNGFLVCGVDAPGTESRFTYPDALSEEIENRFGEYILETGLWSYIRRGQIDLAIRKQKEAIEKRFEVTKYLMHKYPWDFFVCVFTETDRAQHAFWKYMDPEHPLFDSKEARKYGNAILEVYQKLDGVIGYLLEALDEDTTLMIMSDHGAGPCGHKSIYLNNWLHSRGLLRFKDSDGGGSKVIQNLKRIVYTELLSGTLRRMWKSLPRRKKDMVKRLIPDLRGGMASRFFFSRIDMNRSKAYAEESKGFIWINLEGRDPKGTVRPGKEYEELRNYLRNELAGMRCPESGEPVVDNVFEREHIYWGDSVYKAPDLVVTFRSKGYVPGPSYRVDKDIVLELTHNKFEADLRANARHEQNGILLLKGKHVKKNAVIKGAHIMDLAPTILHILGVPVPEDMDGKVLKDTFYNDFFRMHPVKYGSGDETSTGREDREVYSEHEEEIIGARLRDLGYLD